MIVLHGHGQHMTFQLFNNRWDQLRQSATNIACQNRATIFGTPHQMRVDVIMSMSCSISHSKQIITRYSERDNHSFSEKGGRTFSSPPNQRLAPAQGELKVRWCPRADFLWMNQAQVKQVLPRWLVFLLAPPWVKTSAWSCAGAGAVIHCAAGRLRYFSRRYKPPCDCRPSPLTAWPE